MGSCISTVPLSETNITQKHSEKSQQTATLTRESHSIPIEYSLSRGEETEEKEIVPPSITFSTPERSAIRNSISSNQSITPFPTQKTIPTNSKSVIFKMSHSDAKELDFICDELKDIRKGLQTKISILSQNTLLDGENGNCTDDKIKELIHTCKDILKYAKNQQIEMKDIAKQKLEAEQKSLNLVEQCQHWKQCLTTSKQNAHKIKAQRDELSMKLEYYSAEIDHSQSKMIESEAINLSNQQKIRDSETRMNEMRIENGLKLKSAQKTICQCLSDKVAMENEMENKLKCIQTKQKEKNEALQALIKKNNAYLVETQCKINALMEEKEKLSANCVYWKHLCQQQSQMIEGFQYRKSTKTFHARERYLKSLTPTSPTGS